MVLMHAGMSCRLSSAQECLRRDAPSHSCMPHTVTGYVRSPCAGRGFGHGGWPGNLADPTPKTAPPGNRYDLTPSGGTMGPSCWIRERNGPREADVVRLSSRTGCPMPRCCSMTFPGGSSVACGLRQLRPNPIVYRSGGKRKCISR